MSFETAHLTPQNEALYRSIQAALSDGDLTLPERVNILEQYNGERLDVHTESCDARTLLRDEILNQKIDIYQALQAINGTQDLRNLQTLAGVGVDGRLGPRTFGAFFLIGLRHPALAGKSPGEITALYPRIYDSLRQSFTQKTLQERRDIQRASGAGVDGVFGPNTFRSIMQNWDNVKDYFPGAVLGESEDTGRTEFQYMQAEPVTEDPVVEPEPARTEEAIGGNEDDGDAGEDHGDTGIEREQRIAYEIQSLRRNPTAEYREALGISRRFSRNQIRDFQVAIGAGADGSFGPESFVRFGHSELAELGFSLEETLGLRRMITQNDINNLATEISRVYGLGDQELIDGLLSEIGVGDYISYNPYYGEITHIQDGTRREIIKVKEGLFDTFVNVLNEGNSDNRDIIINTLNRIRDRGLRGHYIDLMQAYIGDSAEQDIYPKVRAIFCENTGDNSYSVDFGNNQDLIQKMTASDIFNDQEFLRVAGVVYRRVGENYLTLEGGSRLQILQGTEVQLLTEEEHNTLYEQFAEEMHREELRGRIRGAIGEFLGSDQAKEDIIDYFGFASQREKMQFITSIREFAFENRAFAILRSIFTTQDGESFTIDFLSDGEGVGDIFENTLTAFDLFGDYKTLIKNSVQFTSSTSRNYLTPNGGRLGLMNGDSIQSVSGSERSEEDFSEILEYTPLAAELGRYIRTNYVRAPRQASGITSCGAAVGAALNNFGIIGLPQSGRDGYRWQGFLDARPNQFIKVAISHPNDALPGGILIYDRGATGTPNTQVSRGRRDFGHVEIKCDGNQYCDFARRSTPGGSINSNARGERYKRETGFIGYVYYPRRNS